MRFYLAARYSRREELLGVRDVIHALGSRVTSRWLDGNHQLADDGTPIGNDGEALVERGSVDEDSRAAMLRTKFATDDFEDVRWADTVVAFTEEPRTTNGRGGRHVELGLALAWNKRVIIVGPRENVFCWMPQVEHFKDWRQAAPLVTRLAQR